MIARLLRLFCAAWILPAGFSLIASFGFFTNYTTDVFSRPGIAARYEGSIFRYRVLGRWLVDAVAGWFERLPIEWAAPRALLILDPAASLPTYWAYEAVQAAGTCIGCTFLLVTLRRFSRSVAPELAVASIAMLMALAAFVVTPYDGVFFALQMAAVMLTLSPAWAPKPRRRRPTAVAPLAIVTLLAALTRESAIFIPAFFLAVHHQRILGGDRSARAALAITGAVVVLTYAGLRATLGWSGGGSVYYAWQGATNLKWTSLAGSAMLLAALTLLLADGPNRPARLWYAALSVPYVVFVHIYAEPWEWRLWVPIVVPLVALLMSHPLVASHRDAR